MKVKMVFMMVPVLLALGSCGKQTQTPEQQIKAYPTQVLSKQDVVLQSTYPATIKGQEDIEIRPRINGFIKAIYVDEGTIVRKGQTLFQIDAPTAEQNVRTSQAAVESAKAQLNSAKVNVNRIRPLAEKGIVSNVQLEMAENDYVSAEAALKQAQAALQNAQATASWTNVTSPVNGIVGSIPFKLGSLVDDKNVLTTVSNTGNVFVYFSVNEKELMNLLENLDGNTQREKIVNIPAVTLTLANGSEYPDKGKVETIEGQINNATGSVTIRASFPNTRGLLKSGSSGRITIPNPMSGVVVVPQKATFARQDKIFIYKVQADSVSETLISVLPTPDGKSYVVTNGLNINERVVTDGIITLSQGAKIKVED